MFRWSAPLREAEILSGIALSKEIKRLVSLETPLLSRPPCLAVVLVGSRPDSLRYVHHKEKAAAACGIGFRLITLPESVSQRQLHRALIAVNTDDSVDGVLLQLPLPPHLRARRALFHIHPGKDVDGLHPLNAGNLFLRDVSPLAAPQKEAEAADIAKGTAAPPVVESIVLHNNTGSFSSFARYAHERRFFVPCTALAVRSLVMSYLSRQDSFFPTGQRSATSGPLPPRDLHAVIVNHSMVVGVPTAALLQKERGFLVTLCSRSNSLESLKAITRTADVLVTAYGQAGVFNADFVKEGAVVIDVAVNQRPAEQVTDGRSALCGDIDFDSVKSVARAITPVPGGVGPLTVAHLMQNVLKAAIMRHDTQPFYNSIYSSFLQMHGDSRDSRRSGSDSGTTTTSHVTPSPSHAHAHSRPADAPSAAAAVRQARNSSEDSSEDDFEVDLTDDDNFDC